MTNKGESPAVALSIVVPCFNDEKVLPETYARLKTVLEGTGRSWEILFINDGSRDRTWRVISELHQADARVRGVDLARNFGHQIALTAGFDFCRGEAVVVMDSDLQDPPEVIPELIKKWQEGCEIVYAVREGREGETFFKKFTADLFYWLIKKLSGTNLPRQAGDFRLLGRKAVAAFRKIRERHRYIRGLTVWTGFRQASVPYRRQPTQRGHSGYSLRKLVALALDAVASFSMTPLRISMILGSLLSCLAILLAAAYFFFKIFYGIPYRGWTSLFIGITLFSGIQLLMLGVMGEYVGRIYEEVKRRPLYFIQDTAGVEPEDESR